MSNLSRKKALNGKTHRRKDGRFLPIGVQRRVLVMVAIRHIRYPHGCSSFR